MVLSDGSEQLATPTMIPSSVIDSVEPVRYTYQASVQGDEFFMEMIDISGNSERYGPFSVGQQFGMPQAPDRDELDKPLYLPVISIR